MVIIRGRVDPGRINETVGAFRSLFGAGRWKMEYAVKDGNGKRVDQGAFKADPNGRFTLTVNSPAPGTVEIKVDGGPESAGDICTVNVISENDVVSLPRKLTPKNGRS